MDQEALDGEGKARAAALECASANLQSVLAKATSLHATMSADFARISAEKTDLAALRDRAREISELIRSDHARVEELETGFSERLGHFAAVIDEVERLAEQIAKDLGKARPEPSQN